MYLGSSSSTHELPGRNNLDFAMPVEIDNPAIADVYPGVLGVVAYQIGVKNAPFNRGDRRSTPSSGRGGIFEFAQHWMTNTHASQLSGGIPDVAHWVILDLCQCFFGNDMKTATQSGEFMTKFLEQGIDIVDN